MEEIIKILNEISSTSSRNEKELILNNNKDNILLKKILVFLLDDFIKTGLSKKKINKNVDMSISKNSIDNIEDMINYLSINNTGKDIDISEIKNFINKSNNSVEKDFITSIATKSLKLGITGKTLNKVMPGSVREFGVILAESYFKNEDKITGENEFILTTKLDGVRNIAIVENGNVSCYTRQGQIVDGLVDIEKELSLLPDGVYDGELIAISDKKDSKDIFAETIKISRKKGNKQNLKFVMYDHISNLNCFYNGLDNTPCINRKNKLKTILDDSKFEFIEYLTPLYIGCDKNQIFNFLDKETKNGEEGVMINLSDSPYECKRVKSLLKVKKFNDADVLVTDIIEGDGKNKEKLGAIEIEFEYNNKKYRCNVGSGFSDAERELYWNNKELLLGKIVTIQYFEITKNKNETYGMRFPVWTNRIRNDKTEISMF